MLTNVAGTFDDRVQVTGVLPIGQIGADVDEKVVPT